MPLRYRNDETSTVIFLSRPTSRHSRKRRIGQFFEDLRGSKTGTKRRVTAFGTVMREGRLQPRLCRRGEFTMVYRQNVLYYRCASTNFEELHSVTVPATAKAADIAKNYENNENYRLVRLSTLGGKTIRHFEKSKKI